MAYDAKAAFSFLKQLKRNNNKTFMDEHRQRYVGLRAAFADLVTNIIDELVAVDPTLRGVTAQKCLFRINRDTRFSSNKDPYKTNFAAFIARGGNKSGWPGYYLSLEPGGGSMIAGGVYMPSGPRLLAIRRHIATHHTRLGGVLKAKGFRAHWSGVLDDDAAVKTVPRGFDPDHPALDWLRLKSFTVHRMIGDKEALAPGFADDLVKSLRALAPLNGFLAQGMGSGMP